MSTTPPNITPRSRQFRGIAAILLVLASVQYWIFEAISTAAWHNPGYNYAVNMISDIGVAGTTVHFQGRVVTSPLHALMNGSFAVLGILVLAAIILLFITLTGERIRYGLIALGSVFALGSWLVPAFPENTVLLAHAVGAVFNIFGGNILAILLGVAGARLGFRRSISRVFIALGVIGLIAALLLVFKTPGFTNGADERVAAYTYMVAFVIAGVAIIVNLRTASRSTAISAG